MSDIQIPHSINQADSLLSLADSLGKLLDPNERKKLSDDVVKLHALNETEAKNAATARATIKQNAGILEEAKKITIFNEQERKNISQERAKFESDKISERQKTEQDRATNNQVLDDAKKLHAEVITIQNDISAREAELSKAKTSHAESVSQLISDQKILAEERKKLEEQKQAILDLDRDTKAKVDALKKFNF